MNLAILAGLARLVKILAKILISDDSYSRGRNRNGDTLFPKQWPFFPLGFLGIARVFIEALFYSSHSWFLQLLQLVMALAVLQVI